MKPRVDNPDPAEIGARLRRAREIVFQLEQRAFAERAGIPYTTYNTWETGANRCSLSGAIRLRSTYELDLEYIFFGNLNALPHKIAKALSSSPDSNS